MPSPPTHPPLTPLRAACNTPTRAARSAKRRARTPPKPPARPRPLTHTRTPKPSPQPPPQRANTLSSTVARSLRARARAHPPPACPYPHSLQSPKVAHGACKQAAHPHAVWARAASGPPQICTHTHTQSVCPVCKHGLRTPLLSKHAGSAAMCPGGTDGVPHACKPQKVTTCRQLWLLPSAEHRHCSTGARCPPQAGSVPTVHGDMVVARWVAVLPVLCHPLSAVPRWKPLWS